MKLKRVIFAAALAAAAASLQAEGGLRVEMGFKMPTMLFKTTVKKDGGSNTNLFELADWTFGEDLKLTISSDRAGIFYKFSPKFDKDGLNNTFSALEYNAWWFPFPGMQIYAGTTEDRHWFRGGDERLNNKYGEVSIIDENDVDKGTGFFYNMILDPLKDPGTGGTFGDYGWGWQGSPGGTFNKWKGTQHAYRMLLGWDSADIGGQNALTVRTRWYQGGFSDSKGFFVHTALVQHGIDANKVFWHNDSDEDDQVSWIPEINAEVGYVFEDMVSMNAVSLQAIYKTRAKGHNIFALYAQPRLFQNRLKGTAGVTYVFNRDSKSYTNMGDFDALAIDLRLMYQVTDSFKLTWYGNFSMFMPGEGEGFDYRDVNAKLVDGDNEFAFYTIFSFAYDFRRYGILNLDFGLYLRDIDNNDGFDVGENFTSLKLGWTKWLAGSAGIGVGPEWNHHLNTGDFDKGNHNWQTDEIKLNVFMEVWLSN